MSHSELKLETLLQAAMKRVIDQIVEEEAKAASIRVHNRVFTECQTMLTKIGYEAFRNYSMEADQDQVVIRVKIDRLLKEARKGTGGVT